MLGVLRQQRFDLVVIEAPGKLRTWHALCSAVGLRARCLATLGHLYGYPQNIGIPAIAFADGRYHETRHALRPEVVARVSDAMHGVQGRVLIATDADPEGEAIAADVARLARTQGIRDVLRVRVTSLTPEALTKGLDEAVALDPSDAAPAVARRIADRILAHALSRPGHGLFVGRVATVVAAMADQSMFPTHRASVRVAAADAGGSFWSTRDVHGMKHALALASYAQTLGPVSAWPPQSVPLTPPPGYADYLCGNADAGMDVAQAAGVLQALYEQGAVSYPRVYAGHYADATRAQIVRFAAAHRIRGVLAAVDASAPDGAHEPLHVLDGPRLQGVSLSKPPGLQATPSDRAVAWIAQRMVESVVHVERARGDDGAGLEWTRDSGATPPWYRRATDGVVAIGAERAIVRTLANIGVGRPSTWVSHATRSLQRAVVAPDTTLGVTGARLLDATPHVMHDIKVARAVEQVFATAGAQGPDAAVLAALEMLGQGDALHQRALSEESRAVIDNDNDAQVQDEDIFDAPGMG